MSKSKKLMAQGQNMAESLVQTHMANETGAASRKARKATDRAINEAGKQMGVSNLEGKLDRIDKIKDAEVRAKKLGNLNKKLAKNYKRASDAHRGVVASSVDTAARSVGGSVKSAPASKSKSLLKPKTENTKKNTGILSKLSGGGRSHTLSHSDKVSMASGLGADQGGVGQSLGKAATVSLEK